MNGGRNEIYYVFKIASHKIGGYLRRHVKMWLLNFLLATTVDDRLGHRMEEVASLMVRFTRIRKLASRVPSNR